LVLWVGGGEVAEAAAGVSAEVQEWQWIKKFGSRGSNGSSRDESSSRAAAAAAEV
jgi:hypothetical protein